jgi:PAS domain S-box-containing protein
VDGRPLKRSEGTKQSTVRRPVVITVLTVLALVASGASLILLAATAQDATRFSSLQSWLLIVNLLGVIVLIGLIGHKLLGLMRDWRHRVPGSRMKARAVLTFSGLALLPMMIVYTFSVNAINRGIDSWFDINVGRGLEGALSLSRTALNLREREFAAHTTTIAAELRDRPDLGLVTELDRLRRLAGASEMLVVGDHGHIIAASADFANAALPKPPGEDVLMEARSRGSYANLEPSPAGGLRLLTAAVVNSRATGSARVLVASYPVPEQMEGLADGVQSAYEEYGVRSYERPYLKSSFTLTLTIVLLLSALGAVYGAFFWAARLVKPVQDLIAGTQAVGQGDLDLRLSLPSNDEMGLLFHSFNDMTKRLARARGDEERSRGAVEQERARLAVILAHLSSGVISLDDGMVLRTANPAACSILGFDLTHSVGESLIAVATKSPLVEQFLSVCQRHFAAGVTDWREQVQLRTESGRHELMVACTHLPATHGASAGLIVVFDDITALLRAQRDAAWGEVARRLAHEIKNPLTPIQLSAERMRRRLFELLPEKDAEILERGTHTIIQQVEAMKQMVNAFSEYARAPSMELSAVDLNQVVTEVAELYRSQGSAVGAGVSVRLVLDPHLGVVEVDRNRIRQILNNLLTNACEALEGRADPTVTVETHRGHVGGHDMLEMVVTDNGSGFDPELVTQVFDPYVTSKPKGTGLGLAIVKKIVDEHGGRISADNTADGGARITLFLPLDAGAREFLAAGGRELRRTDVRRERG